MTKALEAALARLHALAFHTEADYEAYLRVSQALTDLEEQFARSPVGLMERWEASEQRQRALFAETLVTLDLRAYAQHLAGCAQTPCTCGLEKLLGEPG